MKFRIYILIVCSFFIFAGDRSFAEPENIALVDEKDENVLNWLTLKDGLETSKDNEKITIVDFYADWCSVCKELDQKTYSDKNVVNELSNFKTVRVDATDLNRDIKSLLYKYGLQGLPAIVFIDKNGKLLDKFTITGFKSPSDFIKVLKSVQED